MVNRVSSYFNIHRKKDGPDYTVSDNLSSLVTCQFSGQNSVLFLDEPLFEIIIMKY